MSNIPHNKGLEREVLAASFRLPLGERAELVSMVKPEFLHQGTVRRLYELSVQHGCAPRVAYDMLWTERSHLNESLPQEDFVAFVEKAKIPSPYPSKAVALQLRRLWARRLLLEEAQRIIASGGDVDMNVLTESVSHLAVRKEGADYNDRPSEVFSEVLHRASVGPDDSESGGFGLEGLDRALRGLRRSDFVVLGAPPNTGKTPFVLDLQRRRSRMGYGHQLFFSREMSKEDIVRELVASDSGIPLDILLNGARPEDRDRVLRKVSDSHEWIDENFSIVDPQVGDVSRTVFRAIVNRKMAELRAKGKKLDTIAVDYLQLFVSDSEQQESEITAWTRMMKIMALELNTPIILISNLNNGYDRRLEQRKADQAYCLGSRADFRGSGNIGFDASKILFLLQHFSGGEPEQGALWVQILKNKFGLKDKMVRVRIGNDLRFSDGHAVPGGSQNVGNQGVPEERRADDA